jgi:hypothetical protein
MLHLKEATGGVAELVKAFIAHPRYPCSDLSINRKIFFFSVCVAFEIKYVGCYS